MLSRWQSTIVDAQGNAQPDVELVVRNELDQSLADIYRSQNESQPYPPGHVRTDETGFAYFYAHGGLYRITSDELEIDWRHVPLGTGATQDIDPVVPATEEIAGIQELALPLRTDIPVENEGPIYVRGIGDMEWDDIAEMYMPAVPFDLGLVQWFGKAVGERFDLDFDAPLPPTDDPRLRFIVLTAGLTGPGGYNEGVLINETISGTSPNLNASAVIDLPGSSMDGITARLVNTTREFFRPGTKADAPQSSANLAHTHTGTTRGVKVNTSTGVNAVYDSSGTATGSSGGVEARPRNIPAQYLMRIF